VENFRIISLRSGKRFLEPLHNYRTVKEDRVPVRQEAVCVCAPIN